MAAHKQRENAAWRKRARRACLGAVLRLLPWRGAAQPGEAEGAGRGPAGSGSAEGGGSGEQSPRRARVSAAGFPAAGGADEVASDVEGRRRHVCAACAGARRSVAYAAGRRGSPQARSCGPTDRGGGSPPAGASSAPAAVAGGEAAVPMVELRGGGGGGGRLNDGAMQQSQQQLIQGEEEV